jgi:hypothetical protein
MHDPPLTVRVAQALDSQRTVAAIAVDLEVAIADVKAALDDLCRNGHRSPRTAR